MFDECYLNGGQRSVEMFVHWSMCHFEFSQGSIVTKQPYLAVPLPLVDCKVQRWPRSQWCNESEEWSPLNLYQQLLHLQWGWENGLQSPVWSVCDRKTLNGMSSLKDICSGLPLNPLPPNRGRDPNLPHAPMRTPNLTAEEERVSKHTKKLYAFTCSIAFGTKSVIHLNVTTKMHNSVSVFL